MTACLFIPSASDARMARRVDFANIASLFAEADEPRPRRDPGQVARILLMIVILLGAIGDTLLVARPGALTSCVTTSQPATKGAHAQSMTL